MPAKNGRRLDEQDCVTPSWRHSRREDNHEALPGSPPNTTGELPLCDDKLLTKKRVLRDQVYAAANEIRGHPGNEPKKVDHVSVLHRLRADGICSQDGTLASLDGVYGFTSTGTLSDVGPVANVGIFAFDGEGNLLQDFTNSRNGVITVVSVTGIYKVNPDCTGSWEISSGTTANFVIVDGGREVMFIRTNPKATITGVLRKQSRHEESANH